MACFAAMSARFDLFRPKSTFPFVKSGVSGEFTYFAGLCSAKSTRPLNAITSPVSLQIGNITRPRNRSYIFPLSSPCEKRPLSFSSISENPPACIAESSPSHESGAKPIFHDFATSALRPRFFMYSRAASAEFPRMSCWWKNSAASACSDSSRLRKSARS